MESSKSCVKCTSFILILKYLTKLNLIRTLHFKKLKRIKVKRNFSKRKYQVITVIYVLCIQYVIFSVAFVWIIKMELWRILKGLFKLSFQNLRHVLPSGWSLVSRDYQVKRVNAPYWSSNQSNPSSVTFRHGTQFFRGYRPLQKREGTGASFLYWLDWKSKD